MKSLRDELTTYLQMRRALGFKLRYPGVALFDFVSFMEKKRESYITSSLALEWSMQPQSVLPSFWAQRLSIVRIFARYLHFIDPGHEIPRDLIGYRAKRAKPFIYSDEQVRMVLAATTKLSGSSLKKQTYRCLIGLLAVSGMRISEALGMKRDNVDLSAGVLLIEGTKFGKSRLIPLHASTCSALSKYAAFRDKHTECVASDYFFVSDCGRKLAISTMEWNFILITRQAGLRMENEKRGPRLHDFRHRFAVKTLIN
jgi:integrase/recombinase XerD